jgi:3'-phosphoadenosine 5'-phosphosulfate sulfotransferase (PAPS reductase)/FAD synthetase
MSELDLGINDRLALTSAEVAAMTRPQRESRVEALIAQSRDFLADAIEQHIYRDGRMVAATVVLFSGGNDSTTLAHLFRDEVEYAAHANTTIGIEATREFVRQCCREWELPLIEKRPPHTYRQLVLGEVRTRDGSKTPWAGGFPGPAAHWLMYQRLKERCLEQVRNDLVTNPRKERVVFIAGRRRQESQRRSHVPLSERKGSTVWVSPLIHWTKLDLNTYRLMCGDVPRNPASDLIHMSGECLCGSFAAPGERAEIDHWFPDALAEVRELEALIADRTDIPDHRKTWGWGADPALKAIDGKPSTAGPLCSSCDDRFQSAFDFEELTA